MSGKAIPAKASSVMDIQHGGNHYKGMKIQPVEIAHANRLCFRVFSAMKYMFRHDKEGGEGTTDIKKAIHYLQILLKQEYKQNSKVEYTPMPENDEDEEDAY